MSGYSDGRRVEHAVVHDLTENGYETQRAASSKGCADVIGIKRGQVVFVNCKRTTPPGPFERAYLIRVAALIDGGVPVVALKPKGEKLQYRRLLDAAPKAWVLWTPDEVDLGAQYPVEDTGEDADPWDAA